MTTSRLFKKTVIAVTVSSLGFASQQALAAGFQLNSQSATGLGRAFAGDAVIADNASVMARNAAAMTLFDSHQFSGGLNVIASDIDVKNIGGIGFGQSDVTNEQTSLVPNIFYLHRLNDSWAFGAGLYSNFGTTNKFDDSFGEASAIPGLGNAASVFAGNTEITSINLTMNMAYRINEQWSVGGGLDIVQGSGKLERSLFGSQVVDIDASGLGIGFNLGAVYELNKNNRFGLAYHYSPTITADGTVNYANDPDATSIDLALPSMVEFSGYHRIPESKFAVHYSLQWIGWNVFDKVETDNGVLVKDYEWKDGYHLSLGGTYYLNDAWTLRAGYMYDTAAQDDVRSISVPDSDRQWFSAGFGYNFKKNHTVDFGLTYLLGKDVAVVEQQDTLELTATTKANAILAGIQYSYSF